MCQAHDFPKSPYIQLDKFFFNRRTEAGVIFYLLFPCLTNKVEKQETIRRMLARRLTDRSVTPNYDPISEASLFTIKVHHGGSFVRGPTRGYIGGKVVFFDYVNRTMISLSDFKNMAEQCGYDKESVVFWHKYGLTLYKVRLVGSNIEVAKFATCIPKDRRHEKNDVNQDYVNEKMQNVEGDSDCVDSDDTGSLNSDCNSENEDSNFPKHNPKTDALNPKLELGLIFGNKKEFKEAVIANQAKIGKSIEWIKDDRRRARAKCRKNGCNWRILGSSMQRDTSFQIKTFVPNHTCFGWNYNNKNITSSWIARRYVDRVRSNKNWKTSEFRDTLSRELRLHVSMHQARRAKEKAIAMIDGDINVQFSILWNYCNEIVRTNLGTSVFLKVTPNEIPNKLMRFQRFYICFAACKVGFKAGCRKIVGVDGCWLKATMYGAQLLSAVTLDGNNNIFPIAYAIVEKENKETWCWFLTYLMNDLEIEEQYLWTFMSDKQKGLLEAFELVLPDVSHRFCVRHLHNNFKKAGFCGMALKNALWKAALATTVDRFDASMADLFELDRDAYAWLSTKLPSEWSRSHFSPLPKCDILLNNQCEVFNKFILDARDKPIIKLLETIRHLLMTRINSNREKAEKWNLGDICPTIKKKLTKIMEDAATYIPKKSNMWNYEVIGPVEGDTWAVDLYNRTCSCRQWELSGIPCKHAISSIWLKNDEVLNYVDDCYKVETYQKIYEVPILPMNGPDLWPKPGHNSRTCTPSSDAVEIHPSDHPCSLDSIMIERASSYHNVEKLPVRKGKSQVGHQSYIFQTSQNGRND
ncbi:hypothetical protein KY290_015134 [Solanum tuberosum]|uniref:SWIM-type domain-containing protein n=1 Tax=Solanum tuberosum TaxID=4113 RepID=A0ABQ7VRT5_SOLTU|nr:hypothetical protein KY290_015134 [Solanum tuberosum]